MSLRLKRVGHRTKIADLRQAGAAKMLFPRGAAITAVSLNTSGGVTGGDRFRTRLHLDPGTRATLTTQAAERFYRAQPGETGLVANRATLGTGAVLHWLPQESIVFDGARVTRGLQVDLASDAEFLAVEPLVFGRMAMGEALSEARIEDRWTVRRGGSLVFADRLRLAGAADATLRACAEGAGAMASLLFVSPRADAALEPVRALLPARAGASLLEPGVLFVRVLARDGFTLRQGLVPALTALTECALPRPWMI